MEIETQKVKVGDILRIKDNQIIPADCVLLSCNPTLEDNDSNS